MSDNAVRDDLFGLITETLRAAIPTGRISSGEIADAVLAAFEVRPRGPVTDAGLHRVELYNADGSPRSLDEIRAEAAHKRDELEAARGVQS